MGCIVHAGVSDEFGMCCLLDRHLEAANNDWEDGHEDRPSFLQHTRMRNGPLDEDLVRLWF